MSYGRFLHEGIVKHLLFKIDEAERRRWLLFYVNDH